MSLSNDDGDGNEDKKTEGLDWQNTNFVRVHFVTVSTRLRRETA